MNTLFKKEWREHFKIGAIGFAIFSLFLAISYWAFSRGYTEFAQGQKQWQVDLVQPLLAGDTKLAIAAFCSIFGALLGWVQIYSEQNRDLWAFLVHRPISRTEIFFSKVMAGLCLYAAGAGLPLLGFFIVVRLPGHCPAPFEWAMILPILTVFLSGTVFYFAGLLTGVRQARWYGSRGLGLAAAIIILFTAVYVPTFGAALIVILIGATILATAAGGSFNSHGFYKNQPAMNQGTVAGTLLLGCFGVVALVTVLVVATLPRPTEQATTYEMTKDGSIYRVITQFNNQTQFTDLHGTPLKDKQTGRPMTRAEFARLAAPQCSVTLNFNTNPPATRMYFQTYNFFTLWRQTSDTLWYLERNGRLWAFDTASRRFLGSLGPNGFKSEVSSGPDRFSRWDSNSYMWFYGASSPSRMLMTPHAIYEPDLENRKCEVFFQCPDDEQIGGAMDYPDAGSDWKYTIVATKTYIRLLGLDGQVVWQLPLAPAYPVYSVEVYFLQPTNQFAVWINPKGKNKTLQTHVMWLAEGKGILKSTNLPQPKIVWATPSGQKSIDVVLPPAFYFVAPLLWGDIHMYSTPPWKDLRISIAVACVCMLAGLGLGWRHRLGLVSQSKWAVFHVLFGLPGLLAFICAQEWPARVPCPHCKKLRAVDRERCEYCEAEFEPPAKVGTEIFEMAQSS